MSFVSETESVASSVVATATAGGPILSAVTGVADAIAQTGKVAETLITSELQASSLNRKQETIARYEEITDDLTAGDADAPAELGTFFNELLLRQGVAVGPLSGRFVRVPMEHVTGFVTALAEGEQAGDLLNGIEQTLRGVKAS